jgi:predicted nuclease of predicted toxin-antitoxin system
VTIRFQADADLNRNIVAGVLRREPSINFQTAVAAKFEGLSDQEVLAIAAKEGRILISHDQRTMPLHFADFIVTQISPGVLIVPKTLPISEVIDALILIWSASTADEWKNRIIFLPL